MMGCYDFCGHYEWTFAWLEAQGGHDLVLDYWDEAIRKDSQRHAAELIETLGFEGMKQYWGHVLEEEAAGYNVSEAPGVFRIVRGLVMDIKTRDYVAAAQTRGESPWYIMAVEILPNASGPIIIDAMLRVGWP